jgi:hypothetical protein
MIDKGARRVPSRVSGLPQSETIKTGTACATRVWRRVLGVEHRVIEWVGLESDAAVKPTALRAE